MPHDIATFAARVRAILLNDNSPAGREAVADVLRAALRDRAFVESFFTADSPQRRVVHEDPELGFCILAHRYTDAKDGPPHDHGDSWAIYGEADGETVMSDWIALDPPGTPGSRRARKVREYTLTPGDVHVYNEGAIHAPRRVGPTRLIRIEGTNLERIARGHYKQAGPEDSTH